MLAEISDLDYRIRQHTDLHNQIRKSKGKVVLLKTATSPIKSPPSSVREPSIVEIAAALTSSSSSLNVNGYRGLLPGSSAIYGIGGGNGSKLCDNSGTLDGGFMADTEEDDENTSCRTRPYQRSAFKKRKLVQTMNLHTISKKAARSR